MKDNFYKSFLLGTVVGILFCLGFYYIVHKIVDTHAYKLDTISNEHTQIIINQEAIAKQLACDLYDECGQFNNN